MATATAQVVSTVVQKDVTLYLSDSEARSLIEYLNIGGREASQFRIDNKSIYAIQDAVEEALA